MALDITPQSITLVGDARALIAALDTLVYTPPADFNQLRGTDDVCVQAAPETVRFDLADPLQAPPSATWCWSVQVLPRARNPLQVGILKRCIV